MNCEEEQSEHKGSSLKTNKFSEEQQQSANSSSHSPSFCVSHNVHLNNNTCRTQNLCFPVATKRERERERERHTHTHTHTHKAKRKENKQNLHPTTTLLPPPHPSLSSHPISKFLLDSHNVLAGFTDLSSDPSSCLLDS
jgi:hypothetical protein